MKETIRVPFFYETPRSHKILLTT